MWGTPERYPEEDRRLKNIEEGRIPEKRIRRRGAPTTTAMQVSGNLLVSVEQRKKCN